MGFLQLYGQFLLRHPAKILFGGVSIVLLLLALVLFLRPLPSFNDPLVGFEARNTLIAARTNAWKLLMDETSSSANNLSLVANSAKYDGSYQSSSSSSSSILSSSRSNNELNSPDSNRFIEPIIAEMSTQFQHNSSNTITVTQSSNSNSLDDSEEEYYKSINATLNVLPSLMHHSLGSSKAFCGKLYEGYAQIVVTPSNRYSSFGLFNLNSMIAICQLDQRLRLEQSSEDSAVFRRDCERFQKNQSDKGGDESGSTCCNSWSFPNYIACLNNKTSCMDIDTRDLKHTEQLLNLCAPYYFKAPYEECFESSQIKDKETPTNSAHGASSFNILSSASRGFDHWPRPYCGSIPEKCLRCDGWTFQIMNYLSNDNFIQNRLLNDTNSPTNKTITASSYTPPKPHSQRSNPPSSNRESIVNKLSYSNIFLPIAKSASLMNYYHILSKYNLKTPYAQVKAMDLGLKNSLFESLISDDLKLFLIALVSILLVISIYTWSFILSLVILAIICLSLCLSYVIYELIFDIPIFPFMNLLAVVISFGICSDNAMLFCKHWTLIETDIQPQDRRLNVDNRNGASLVDKKSHKEKANLDRMLKRAIVSTFVATLATACSFIISAISRVIAVRCFCIFATLSVITNYLLIVFLLPPALILDSRFSDMLADKISTVRGPRIAYLVKMTQYFRIWLLEFGQIVHSRWIFNLVTRYKLYLIITFITVLSCSSILVFHRPRLQPADEDNIQLLSSKHEFEQYDRNLKRQFAFEKFKMGETPATASAHLFYDALDTLPVRIVFGIKPIDNGNHLDPQDRGTLVFDPKFDLAEPNVQIWLLEFCQRLRQQRFIHPSSAPDLTNCFMDTFKSWMDARKCMDPVQPDLDRSPCCESYEFPYSRNTFNKCIGEAVNIMRKTPQFHPNINAGVRFFKNSTRVAALIIEYQSNRLFSESFTKMDRFFNDIDEWVTWQINNTAPQSLRSGWFVSSNLELLALQTELEQSTTSSILLEVVFAMMALMVGTCDLVLTIAGTLTIGTIIIVTVAALIILRWTLGVAESILISLTIGLSIDFALHYTVAYSESRKMGASDGIIMRILNEVGSPIALATLTTSLAGFVIVWSDILAYQELGVFLMLIALISWMTSTFFLLPMLSTIGSIIEHGEMYARVLLRRALKLLIDRL